MSPCHSCPRTGLLHLSKSPVSSRTTDTSVPSIQPCFWWFRRGLPGSAQGPAPRRPRRRPRGRRGLRTSLSDMYPNGEQGMHPGEGAAQAPGGTVVPQKLLEEMLWFFRVEDASPWNISILVLVGVVVVVSIVLLRRNIKARRKQKKLPPAKQTPEVSAETRTKDDNSVNIVRETLLSEKPDLAQEEIELGD
ncbi:organic solute transporter subunit beta [Glossophaga mutica]